MRTVRQHSGTPSMKLEGSNYRPLLQLLNIPTRLMQLNSILLDFDNVCPYFKVWTHIIESLQCQPATCFPTTHTCTWESCETNMIKQYTITIANTKAVDSCTHMFNILELVHNNWKFEICNTPYHKLKVLYLVWNIIMLAIEIQCRAVLLGWEIFL